MDPFKKATKLTEVAAVVRPQPLELDDPRYVNIEAGRGTDELKQLRFLLMGCDAQQNLFAKASVTGHRGCGKSTELLRLEHEVASRFTCLHIVATEDPVVSDYDYTDLFLWIVDTLVRRFAETGTPLTVKLVEDVACWFADVTKEDIDKVKAETNKEIEVEAKGKLGLFGWSLALLARLKSKIMGSTEHRKTVRRELQNYSAELVRKINLLLDNAHMVLEQHGKPANLLIVVDNLDRLLPEVSEPLFFVNGDHLKALRAHMIYTVPIATALSRCIGTVFENSFTVPIAKVHDRREKSFAKGIEALVEVVAARVELDAIFHGRDVVRYLVKMSGGSLRDLMRLIQSALLVTGADEKEQIDLASAKRAVQKMRLDFERLLIPRQVFYPLLAQIHWKKCDFFAAAEQADLESVKKFRDFFCQLLFNGSVLEYDGGENWYDVHPVIKEIQAFQEAVAHVNGKTGEAKAD